MTTEERTSYRNELAARGSKPGLSRIKTILDRLGNPQNKQRVLHIAGTNGKGSIVAYLEAVLRHAGYTVGAYTSPSVFDYYERIRLSGKPIDPKVYDQYIDRIKEVAPKDITLFEFETAMAFQFFLDQKADFSLIECGMGGLNDATNVTEKPILTILSSVSLDHQKFLGDTVEEIAKEKCGILRKDVPCVIYPENEGKDTILACAKEIGAITVIPDLTTLEISSDSFLEDKTESKKQREAFLYHDRQYTIPLSGKHQILNALTAIEALKQIGIPEKDISAGLVLSKHPGRFEILNHSPVVIRDGAHNIGGAKALYDELTRRFPEKKLIYIIGILADKDYRPMLELLLKLAKKVYCLTVPDNPRALSATDLYQTVSDLGIDAEIADSPEEAIKTALEEAESTDVIVAFGSLYYIGRICV